ncbi:MAG: phospholipid carrier-dependent glycosyltransferase [bacterium]|nr:phospholipid carrier-dependent glycosyltransferase [bacterium]
MINKFGLMSLPPLKLRGWAFFVFILLFTATISSLRVGMPSRECFDECYYHPGAYSYIKGTNDKNFSHPPLAKIMIAEGILFGHALQKMGIKITEFTCWRLTSLFFGLGMVALTFALAYRLSRGSESIAALSAFLVAIDFLHFTMSRICMLDMVVAFWILLGIYLGWCYIEAQVLGSPRSWSWAILCALVFGVSVACKWNGLFGAGATWLLMVILPHCISKEWLVDQAVPELPWREALQGSDFLKYAAKCATSSADEDSNGKKRAVTEAGEKNDKAEDCNKVADGKGGKAKKRKDGSKVKNDKKDGVFVASGPSVDLSKTKDNEEDEASAVGSEHQVVTSESVASAPVNSSWLGGSLAFLGKNWKRTLILAVIFTVLVGSVYSASFLPQAMRTGFNKKTLNTIIKHNKIFVKFRYNSKKFNHRYQSPYWAWPLSIRPVYLKYSHEHKDTIACVICFGSIVFWWPGLVFTLEFFCLGWREKKYIWAFLGTTWFLMWFLWASSTAGGFIFYMLPGIPIMSIVVAWVMHDWYREGYWKIVAGYLSLLSVAFMLYYPVLSCLSVPDSYYRTIVPLLFRQWR